MSKYVISKIIAKIYQGFIILFSPWLIVKYVILKIFKRNYTYTKLTGGLIMIPCKSKNDVDTLFAVYRIPDKNFSATLYRLFRGLSYFIIPMSYEEYLKLRVSLLYNIAASKKNYKDNSINVPNNLFKK